MNFISYAQNFEDVMLWRALKDVKNGFYIDIGANDPEIDSVTKSMYDLGWKGINCEPVSHWFEKLAQERPNDINIQVAIGAQNTELTFYEVVDTGLSTLNKETAEKHAKELGYKVKEYLVPVRTLTSICKEKNINTIHFLKIDVEGAEKSVLEGINFKEIRPWIIVIEATKPMSENVDFEEWEELIISENYHFVYFDGLNRFYVADEHTELDKAFMTPPNVFDRFTLIGQITAIEEKEHWWKTADEATKWAQDNEKKYNTAIKERDKWWKTADEASKWAQDNEKKYHSAIAERDKWWKTADEASKWAQNNEKKYNLAIEERDKWWKTADEASKWAQNNEKKYNLAIEERDKCGQENEKKLSNMSMQLNKTIETLNTLQVEYNTITKSLSWRVTKPFRFTWGKIKLFLGRK